MLKSRSESVEMYLKSVAELGGEHEPVPIGRIAGRMGVTAVSASEMVKRLEGQQLVSHLPYKGVVLTDSGRWLARNVIRRQRLWECFLVDHLHLDWAASHEIACDLEHATATVVTEALATFLGHPIRCPHGNPIPDADGHIACLPGVPLSSLELGCSGRIVAVEPVNSQVLVYLAERKMRPGNRVTVVEVAPLQGPLTVQVGRQAVVLGLNLAALILVEEEVVNNSGQLS